MSVELMGAFAVGPVTWAVKKAIESFNESEAEALAKSTSSEEVQLLAEKQRLQMELMEGRAKAAQELALAQRLAMAEEIEIEEYYDGSGEGALGLDAKADAKTETAGATLGLRGKGRVMRKRIIRLKGTADLSESMEWVQKNLDSND